MIWLNNEILLEVKGSISRVNMAFILTTGSFMKKNPEKETEKNKPFDTMQNVKKTIFSIIFHQQS